MKKIVFILITAILTFSCGSNQDRTVTGEEEDFYGKKLHGYYIISDLRTENLMSDNILFRFDSIRNELAGNAGCNRFVASYNHSNEKINFQPAASTKMYCEGKMDREKEIIDILPSVTTIIRQENEIILFSDEKELLLKLKQTSKRE